MKKAIALLLALAMSVSLVSMVAAAEEQVPEEQGQEQQEEEEQEQEEKEEPENSEEPQMAGSSTEVDYLLDSNGKKIGVKSAKINGITYYDLNGGEKMADDMEPAELYKKAMWSDASDGGSLLGYWAQVAYMLFKEHTHYTVYGKGDARDTFDQWKGGKEVGQGFHDIQWQLTWTQDSNKAYDGDGKNNSPKRQDHMNIKQLKSANSLNDVRRAMAGDIASGIGSSTDRVLDSIDGNVGLPLMTDTTRKTVLYTTATHTYWSNDFMNNRWKFNAYGLAFYDFKITPILDSGLEIITAAEGYKDIEEAAKNNVQGVSYQITDKENSLAVSHTNRTGVTTTEDTSRSVSVTQTLENHASFHHDYSFTESVNTSFNFKFTELFKWSLGFEFSASQMFGWEHGSSVSDSQTHTDTVASSIDLPPYTGIVSELSTGFITESTEYNCPVEITYKVAIFSMSGAMAPGDGGQEHWGQYNQKNSVFIFGDKYGDAAKDLREQQYKMYAKTDGSGEKPVYSISDAAWSNFNNNQAYSKQNSGQFAKQFRNGNALKDTLYNNVPMSTHGAEMSNTLPSYGIEYQGDIYPLRSLKHVMFADLNPYGTADLPAYGTKEMEMKVGVDLVAESSNIGLRGYIDVQDQINRVKYYGFDPQFGSWILTDEFGTPLSTPKSNGNEIITETASAKLTYNSANTKFKLEAKKPGIIYMKYLIGESTYTSDEQRGTYTKNSDLSVVAMIKVTATEVIHDGTVRVTGSVSGLAGDVIDLNSPNSGVTAMVYNKNGIEIAVNPTDIKWEQENLRGVFIDENNQMTLQNEGTYHIRPNYHGKFSDWADVIVAKPTVTVTGSVSGLAGDVIDLNSPNSGVRVKVTDPTGKEIRVNASDIKWEAREIDGISIDENNKMTLEKDGIYGIRARYGGVFSDWATVTVGELKVTLTGEVSGTVDDVIDLNSADSGAIVKVYDQTGKEIAFNRSDLKWEKYYDGISIDENNQMTLKEAGTYGLRVWYGKVRATGMVNVVVKPKPPESISEVNITITQAVVGDRISNVKVVVDSNDYKGSIINWFPQTTSSDTFEERTYDLNTFLSVNDRTKAVFDPDNIILTINGEEATTIQYINKSPDIIQFLYSVTPLPVAGTVSVTGSVNGMVGDVIDLNSADSGLTVKVYDKAGKEIEVNASDIKWEQRESGKITINTNNQMTLRYAGTNAIRARYDGVTSDWADVTVSDYKMTITGSVSGTKGDVIDLNSPNSGLTVKVFDPTGKEVTVNASDIKWEDTGVNEGGIDGGISIDQNNQMTLKEEGIYIILADYYGGVDLAEVTVGSKKEISTISLYVTEPAVGETPDKIATSDEEGFTCDVAWNPNDRTFKNGYNYKANMTISSKDGYAFDDDVVITVNGEPAQIIRHASTKIAVSYDFGIARNPLDSSEYDDDPMDEGGGVIVFDDNDDDNDNVCLIYDLMVPVATPFSNTLAQIFSGEE
ncbi:MAG: hypothetical protein FWG90_09975 [Oscillospiraceae bacterium]|nr:hypothetical protein [Oscillospiraceae bacterium]